MPLEGVRNVQKAIAFVFCANPKANRRKQVLAVGVTSEVLVNCRARCINLLPRILASACLRCATRQRHPAVLLV